MWSRARSPALALRSRLRRLVAVSHELARGSPSVAGSVLWFKAGRYSAATQANVASHFGAEPALDAAASATVGPQATPTFAPGMGGGFGRGMGRGMGRGGGGVGMGRGMGRGGGRGMGMGRGMGRGGAFASPVPDLPPQPQSDSTREIAVLKAQAQAVERQLAALNERMGQMQTATDRHLVAVVAADRCNACGLCVQVCVAGAITVNGAAKIDGGTCTACGQCVAQCPQGAIVLRKA